MAVTPTSPVRASATVTATTPRRVRPRFMLGVMSVALSVGDRHGGGGGEADGPDEAPLGEPVVADGDVHLAAGPVVRLARLVDDVGPADRVAQLARVQGHHLRLDAVG